MANKQGNAVIGFLQQVDVKLIIAAQAAVTLGAVAAAGWVAGTQRPTAVQLIDAARGQAAQSCEQAAAPFGASISETKDGVLTISGKPGLNLRQAALETAWLQTQCTGHTLQSACLGSACEARLGTSYRVELIPRKMTGGGA